PQLPAWRATMRRSIPRAGASRRRFVADATAARARCSLRSRGPQAGVRVFARAPSVRSTRQSYELLARPPELLGDRVVQGLRAGQQRRRATVAKVFATHVLHI